MNKQNLKLLAALRLKGVSQADLVERAGLTSESRLSRIIRGRVSPTRDEVRKICRYLKLARFEIGFLPEEGGGR